MAKQNNMLVRQNSSGTYNVYDLDQQQIVFDGSKDISIPIIIFIGDKKKAQSILDDDNAVLSALQTKMIFDTAILNNLPS
jgi:hypothetical protein